MRFPTLLIKNNVYSIMTDQFWFQRPEILFQKNRMMEFWPSKFQTYEERVNALTRFILYAGVILSFYKHNSEPFVMAVLLVAVLVVVSRSKNKVLEKLVKRPLGGCQEPSSNNPMGNQLPFDSTTRQKGCAADLVQDQITENLFAQFPTKGLSTMNKDFIERQFFSTANTDVVNDQHGFASWLYGAPNRKMCKSNPEVCTGSEGRINGGKF